MQLNSFNLAKPIATVCLLLLTCNFVYAQSSAYAGDEPSAAVLELASEKETWSAFDWLTFMQDAMVRQNYTGTFVFVRGSVSSSMSIVHKFENGIESERLKQLDGEMGEIIRHGKKVMCVFPDNRVVEVESSPLSTNFTDKFVGFMPGQSQYKLNLKGVQRLVDHSCTVIEVLAKDEDRYSYRLWIDSDKGLLLKSEIIDLDGSSLERVQYTQIEYHDKIDSSFFEFKEGDSQLHHEMIPMVKKDQNWPEEMMWELSWMPAGYKKINGEAKAGDNIMVYSDGLATFSVFVEKMKDEAMPEGASRVGATIAYSMDNTAMGQHYHITVVGEIPPMTAMKVAKAVVPKM